MPFSIDSLKAKLGKSKNSEGDARLKIQLSGVLLPDTNVDWYYLTFKLFIKGDSESHEADLFLANKYQTTGNAVPLISYKQGHFTKSIFFKALDYMPTPKQRLRIILESVAYKGKSWYEVSSKTPRGNSILELQKIGIIPHDINEQLAKSINKIGFAKKDKPSPKKDKRRSRAYELICPLRFNKKSSIRIANFNLSKDTLEINNRSFKIEGSATFAHTKNKTSLKKISRKDVDFIYDRKKGYLYFNENGSKKGFGDGGIIAIFKDSPKLSLTNLVYIRETLRSRKKYNNRSADKITNFHPSSEKIAIKVKGFGIKDSPSFKPAKNRKEVKKLAKKDIDFLYDQKKGGLYFNENGTKKGFGDGGLIAILKSGPDLSSKNVRFIQ